MGGSRREKVRIPPSNPCSELARRARALLPPPPRGANAARVGFDSRGVTAAGDHRAHQSSPFIRDAHADPELFISTTRPSSEVMTID